MKQYFVLLMIFYINSSCAQGFYANGHTETPNIYNSFINNPTISWAARFDVQYSFLNCPYKKYASIYDYLIYSQREKLIKSYIFKYDPNNDDDSISNHLQKEKDNPFIEVNYPILKESFGLDSLKELYFNQIVIVENHHLKSYIIAAAPEFKITTGSDIYLGNSYNSLCSINRNRKTKDKNDSIVFLKTTHIFYNDDSLRYSNAANIKTTYGMNLISTLWYDLSKGYNKIIDLKTNKVINPLYVWNYPIADIKVEMYDSVGNPIGYKLARGVPALPYIPKINIQQDWYYNATKNIFYNDIKQVDVYIYDYELGGIEKRFKILFK